MKQQRRPRRAVGVVAGAAVLGAVIAAPSLYAGSTRFIARSAEVPLSAVGVEAPAAESLALTAIDDDSLYGRSGKRLFRLAPVGGLLEIGALRRLFGDSVLQQPGVYAPRGASLDRPFSLIAMLPFTAKVNGAIGRYRIGFWPGEKGTRARSAAYANPQGFIEVTPENQDTKVSEHFRLRDFLTHDQQSVWPKYLVLREELIDKLELVIDELERSGVPVKHMAVMSGFRTPQYNENGGDPSGRASASRHQYGDAADVFIDNDGDGRMDDLNGDGRTDARDALVIQQAVERVERAHGDLVGGVGLYRATAAHGPFAHIDVRGHRARWGHA